MAELGAVYASALFDIFLERLSEKVSAIQDIRAKSDLEERSLADIVLLKDILNEEECRRILLHPHVSTLEKQSFLKKMFTEVFKDSFDKAQGGNFYADLLGFILLAISKNREPYIVPAFEHLIKKIEKYQRKTTARVISAKPLEDEKLAALRDILAKKLNKHVEIELLIDPAVIGGINIFVDGFYIDRTLKHKLQGMKSSVMSGVELLTAQRSHAQEPAINAM